MAMNQQDTPPFMGTSYRWGLRVRPIVYESQASRSSKPAGVGDNRSGRSDSRFDPRHDTWLSGSTGGRGRPPPFMGTSYRWGLRVRPIVYESQASRSSKPAGVGDNRSGRSDSRFDPRHDTWLSDSTGGRGRPHRSTPCCYFAARTGHWHGKRSPTARSCTRVV